MQSASTTSAEGHGQLPPAASLYNVMGEFQVRYRYANGVEMHHVGRKDYAEGESYMLFEGTEGRVRAWRAPNRIEAKPKSILDAKVKVEDFPFLLRSAAPRLFGSYNEEQAK